MVLDKLGSSLKGTLQKIAKSIFVDDKLINELIKDIQRALLQSDMNVKLVFDLTSKIKERIKKEKALSGLTKKEQLVNIVYEELVIFLGKEQHKIEITKKPFKIMLAGLFGSGKTTSAGKLAKYFIKRGNKVALVGLDVHRPAAMAQLEQVSKQANTPCFINKKEKNPIRIYNEFKNELKKFDVIIIDTSGRDALSKDLIQELESLNKEIKPHENLLVISADIGQAAEKQATQFHKSCNITGVIVSKMDGTARGGGALTACAVSKAPIKFIGVGEKIDDLEHFNPQGFVGRLLGMGDLEALLEKAKHAIKAEDAEDLGKKFLKGEFNLIDLYEQMAAMKKMGSLKKIVEMVPGFSSLQLPKEMLDVQEEKLEKWKIAMLSMTKEELENPDEITSARIDRISKGSAMPTSVIRELIKQYRQSKKVVKMFKGSKGDMSKMMKKFGGKLPGNFKM
ncbi:MAG: signal recognition particle receptor subunit alpha [Candidatus Woesearchaeota archaeon]|jgi:signal recognition particle subunit SRP54|nr:signal recognition particle receptor subunit alpha [Candidatus Woesearchaeota archaeon]MDP7622709.1 signal recognition particle receptor subunit alpha [Candidatus Woesearchaeota archaeon]HJN57050.1 signal recognition particle receptor subunit alpha [Candidatus Woesearchaeota archaeon]|tara:strand:+ start:7534 stop:8889 length:1356 start_codon:yes stop_codon:yes gene_type:complete